MSRFGLVLQGGFFASNRFTKRVPAAQRELMRTSPVASQPLDMHILLICAGKLLFRRRCRAAADEVPTLILVRAEIRACAGPRGRSTRAKAASGIFCDRAGWYTPLADYNRELTLQ